MTDAPMGRPPAPTAACGPAPPPRLFLVSEHTLLLRWLAVIDPVQHARILATRDRLQAHFAEAIEATVPTYSELAIHLRPPFKARALAKHLEAGAFRWPDETVDASPLREVTLPVCYEPDVAPDLSTLAERHGMTPDEVIARHTAPWYRVYFLGFLPGFAYLGGMDPALATPRLAQPRPRVPAGSVGIAGAQTGVYPSASPGGWNLIGRTPRVLFRPRDDGQDAARGEGKAGALLRPGDAVRFVAIDRATFDRMLAERAG
jgi:inhibitor of KinA